MHSATHDNYYYFQNLTIPYNPEFEKLVSDYTEQFRIFLNLKRFDKGIYKRALKETIKNAYLSAKNGKWILYSRQQDNWTGIKGKSLGRVVDFLTSIGLLESIIGIRHPEPKITSSFMATDKFIEEFLNQFKIEKFISKKSKEYPLVTIRKKKSADTYPEINQNSPKILLDQTKGLIAMNKILSKHEVSIDNVVYQDLEYHKVFNSNNFDLGGRCYMPIQNLSKVDRSKLLIDGNETIEVDFSCLHPRMLYALNGIQFNDDVYYLEGYDSKDHRDLIKIISLQLINDKSVNFARAHLKRNANILKKDESGFENILLYKNQRIINELIDKFLDKHQRIVNQFNLKNIGLKLQNYDSKIADRVFYHLSQNKIPTIGVHDSFIVENRHKDLLIEIMNKSYEEIIGHGFSCKLKY